MQLVRLALIVAALTLVPACSGGGPQDLLVAQASVMDECAEVLEGIDDTASLDAAKPKLRTLGVRMSDLAQRWEQLLMDGAANNDAEVMIDESNAMVAATSRMQKAWMKLMLNPELQPHIPALMQELGNAFEKPAHG